MHDIYGELRRLGTPRMSKIYTAVPPPFPDPKPRSIQRSRTARVREALKLWLAKGNKIF